MMMICYCMMIITHSLILLTRHPQQNCCRRNCSPVNEKEFTTFIKTHHPTYLTALLTKLSSVSKINLTLPENKRDTIDKYLTKGRLPKSKESCMMSIVEVFLLKMKFWENSDESYFRTGYSIPPSHVQLKEAIKKTILNSRNVIGVLKDLLHFNINQANKVHNTRINLAVNYIC